jgi:hypothetical protein
MRSFPPVDGNTFQKSFDNALHAFREEKRILEKKEAGKEKNIMRKLLKID